LEEETVETRMITFTEPQIGGKKKGRRFVTIKCPRCGKLTVLKHDLSKLMSRANYYFKLRLGYANWQCLDCSIGESLQHPIIDVTEVKCANTWRLG